MEFGKCMYAFLIAISYIFYLPKTGYGIEIKGDWLDMNFRVLHQGELVGTVSKKWFSWGDSYKVEITKEELEELMIAIVVAIDCVISDENATVNATTTP